MLTLVNLTLAQGDTEPPHLADFDFDPKAINTSESDQGITFTARITDDLGGMDSYWFSGVQFKSPSGGQLIEVNLTWSRESGTPLDGVYINTETLPQYSETGVWSISWFNLTDRLGNSRYLDQGDVATLGFPTEFVVEGVGDTDPPHLADFGFTPTAINTSESDQDITFTARITDDLGGIRARPDGSTWFNGVQFTSPSGGQSIQVSFVWYRESGTPLDGIYVREEALPQYSETGVWKLERITLVDRLGNHRNLDQADVAALGFPTEFLVCPDFVVPPVDVQEIQAVATNIGKDSSDPNWNNIENLDLDRDGNIDIQDLIDLAIAWRLC